MRTEVIVDDLTGEPDAQTVWFAYQGQTFQIDLSEASDEKLRDLLMPYIAAGRKVASTMAKINKVTRPAVAKTNGQATTNGHAKANGSTRSDPAFLASVKAWAASQGISVAPRGRVAKATIEAYQAAQVGH